MLGQQVAREPSDRFGAVLKPFIIYGSAADLAACVAFVGVGGPVELNGRDKLLVQFALGVYQWSIPPSPESLPHCAKHLLRRLRTF